MTPVLSSALDIRVLAAVIAVSLMGSACTSNPPSDAPPDSTNTPTATTVANVSSSTSESSGAKTSTDNRSVAQKLKDASTETRVTRALVESSSLRVHSFDPTVRDGHLILKGNVKTAERYRRAERIAQQIEGVSEFTNHLTINGQAVNTENPESNSPSAEETAEYYTVRPGDTLWDIAKEYRASVHQIRQLNGLGSSSLSPGDRIRVR